MRTHHSVGILVEGILLYPASRRGRSTSLTFTCCGFSVSREQWEMNVGRKMWPMEACLQVHFATGEGACTDEVKK